ncbi:ArsR/SmtB family transcription factor [Cellulomonas soli]|uniref:HTH arsR-type domain-containing protein n=1 Tax=Cellulomonas soli TaxID=931535 RepID=A0A512PE32_9CELL|nr:metalloregulator ArsR/SmtB family transcription factor [Cellulomonas soli]NYI59097.1 DNA-binding transcriptional ArsR family regulator [Cellulomonas soli]GEP69412.1 hypothetical protein CSO01_21270 [Cellulomonas soli]
MTEPLDDALRAVAEPRRRAILHLVADRELPAGEIAAEFDISRPAVSQHLGVLRSAGLLHERRDGTRRLYRADLSGLAPLRLFLEDLWSTSLDTARELAEAEMNEVGTNEVGTNEVGPARTGDRSAAARHAG